MNDATLLLGGVTRSYHVSAGPLPPGPRPLMLLLHGSYTPAPAGTRFAGLTQFNAVADRFGMIACYPDALGTAWDTTGPDTLFVVALLATLQQQYPIDPTRTYVCGMSNGATFAETMGCTLSTTFAAIGSVAGHVSADVVAASPPTVPMPVISFHGTNDLIYSYKGYAGAFFGQHLMGAVDSQEMWAYAAGADVPVGQSLPDALPADGTSVVLTTCSNPADGSALVDLYTITNGGHTWPGGRGLPVGMFGLTTHAIDASSLIGDFCMRFTRP